MILLNVFHSYVSRRDYYVTRKIYPFLNNSESPFFHHCRVINRDLQILCSTMTNDTNINDKQTLKNGHTYVQWGIALLVNLSVITYGLQIGWVSPVVKLLQSEESPTGRPLSDSEISWISSLPPLLSAFCASPYSWLVDRFGRRFGVMTIGVAQAVCWALTLTADPACLVLSRIFTGIAAAACYNIIPMYIKEISQDNMRGILGFTVMLSQNVGVLIIYLMGVFLDYYLVLWILTPIPVLSALMMLLAPESPVYLVKIGKTEKAASTIAYLRGLDSDHKLVQNDMNAIKHEDEVFKSIPNVNFLGILKHRPWRNGFIIMFMLMSLRGFNGGMAIIVYASTILTQSGVTINPELHSVSFPTLMIAGCFAAMCCVERLGRRLILAVTSLISVVSFAGLAVIIMIQEAGGVVPGWLPVSVLVAGEFAFAAGVSPLPFIIMSEMFNFQIRAKVMGILAGLAWFMAFLQLIAFAPVTAAFGAHVTFFTFAAVNFMAIVVTVTLLPETKGKNIEQIENALVGNRDVKIDSVE